MREEDRPLIRQNPLFSSMEESNFEALVQAAYFQQFPAGVQMIREGEPADFLHVVFEGMVELFARSGGKETLIDLVSPCQTFILAAVVRDNLHLMSARTSRTSKILMIPARDIRDTFERDAAFALSIVHELSGRYRGMVKALKNQKLRTSVERLANYLLRQELEQGGNGRLRLALEKRALASLLGMTPENLSRAFGTLAPYGVEVDGAVVHLTNPKDLAALAKPNRMIDDPAS